jgi:hypothetical protein
LQKLKRVFIKRIEGGPGDIYREPRHSCSHGRFTAPSFISERLISQEIKDPFMRLTNQVKVALVTALCLLGQGYVFTYILKVEPGPLIAIAPLFLYIAYIYARGRETWSYDRPLYWCGAVLLLTLIDLAPFVLGL